MRTTNKKSKSNNKAASEAIRLICLAIVLLTIAIGIYIVRHDNLKIDAKLSFRKLINLELHIANQLNTPSYNIRKAGSSEIMRGLKGPYYIVNLKDSKTNYPLFFDTGKYYFRENDERLLTALTSLDTNLIKFANDSSGIHIRMFIQGHADSLGNRTFRGHFEKDLDSFTIVKYCPFIRQYRYDTAQEIRHIRSDSFNNEDLPYLRAAYIAKRLTDIYSNVETKIIQGNVSNRLSDLDRNGIIILYLDTLR